MIAPSMTLLYLPPFSRASVSQRTPMATQVAPIALMRSPVLIVAPEAMLRSVAYTCLTAAGFRGARLDEFPAEYPADRATDRADWTADTAGTVGAPFRSNTVRMIGLRRGARIGRCHRFAGRGAQTCLSRIGVGQHAEDCRR